MDVLLILTYTAFCVAVFKIFKIPLNKWSVPTAILGGIVMIGSLILLMNYNHPYTTVGQTISVTTPIVPLVRGRVAEVPVDPNMPVVKGDILFSIEPDVYQAAVDEQRAALAQALQNVGVSGETLNQAKAVVASAQAERDRAKANYDRYERGNRLAGPGNSPFPQAQIQNARDTFLSSEANLDAARAGERSAKLSFEAEIDGDNTEVARIRARLASAEFNLEQTVIRAPTDGMVTQLLLRPGMIAVPAPLRPTMVFVHAEETRLIGSFLQNYLQRITAGSEAEVIFPALPGKIFKGRVELVLPVLAEGSVQATGNLIALNRGTFGRAPVVIALDDDVSNFNLPAGVAAEVAIYTEHFSHVSIMRKILVRMKSWQNFLLGEFH